MIMSVVFAGYVSGAQWTQKWGLPIACGLGLAYVQYHSLRSTFSNKLNCYQYANEMDANSIDNMKKEDYLMVQDFRSTQDGAPADNLQFNINTNSTLHKKLYELSHYHWVPTYNNTSYSSTNQNDIYKKNGIEYLLISQNSKSVCLCLTKDARSQIRDTFMQRYKKSTKGDLSVFKDTYAEKWPRVAQRPLYDFYVRAIQGHAIVKKLLDTKFKYTFKDKIYTLGCFFTGTLIGSALSSAYSSRLSCQQLLSYLTMLQQTQVAVL